MISSDQKDAIALWAYRRKLIGLDGKPDQATPIAQAQKTAEECQEVYAALTVWGVIAADPDASDWRRCKARHQLALEYGDVLFTLVMQCLMQGIDIRDCIDAATHSWLIDEASLQSWGRCLETVVANENTQMIGATVGDIWQATRRMAAQQGFDPNRCLDLVIRKNNKREGKNVGGAFVKETA